MSAYFLTIPYELRNTMYNEIVINIPNKLFHTLPLNIMPLKLGRINSESRKRVFSIARNRIGCEHKYWWRRKKLKKSK